MLSAAQRPPDTLVYSFMALQNQAVPSLLNSHNPSHCVYADTFVALRVYKQYSSSSHLIMMSTNHLECAMSPTSES